MNPISMRIVAPIQAGDYPTFWGGNKYPKINEGIKTKEWGKSELAPLENRSGILR